VAYILSEHRDVDPSGAFRRYGDYLDRNRERFPTSAYGLATSAWWFDFRDHRCPHDARLESAHLSESSSGERFEKRALCLTLRLLGAYHDGHIELYYSRVSAYRIDASNTELGHRDWRYDEFRVDDAGSLEHEIEWSGSALIARWRIVASDVEFKWIPIG
jgi:hypothetical protein